MNDRLRDVADIQVGLDSKSKAPEPQLIFRIGRGQIQRLLHALQDERRSASWSMMIGLPAAILGGFGAMVSLGELSRDGVMSSEVLHISTSLGSFITGSVLFGRGMSFSGIHQHLIAPFHEVLNQVAEQNIKAFNREEVIEETEEASAMKSKETVGS